MKTVVCESFGPPEQLQQIEVPAPQPAEHQILVDVEAAGVGFVDGLMVQGLYQVKPSLPYYPGSEFAGTISQIGSQVGGQVSNLQAGDRVMGLASQGAFADQLVIDAHAVVPLSENLDSATAAGFFINYATALYGLCDCGHLQRGETVLILGAAGGVGSAAICVAKAMGAHVIAAASNPSKREAAMRYGADACIDYTLEDWRKQLPDCLPAGQGLNLVYDPVGGAVAEPAFRSLAPGGRFLVVGFASGTIPKLALNLALLKRSAIVGVDWGGESRADPSINAELMQTLMSWMDSGALQPAEVCVRPMATFREALSDQLAGNIIGKLVLSNQVAPSAADQR
ncbi:MAG: NADPH:quinone oxidoreductase family protein [Pseudomonadota bacterium]